MNKRTRYCSILVAAAMLPVTADAPSKPLEVGGLTFKPTAPWTADATPRPMSQGGFSLPGKEGAPGLQAAFYHFPGQGGDVEANVKRWAGQFKPEPKLEREKLKAADKEITLVTISGTYVGPSFRPEPEPRADTVMLAAIVPGDGPIFIRMHGPSARVTAAKDDFKKLVASGAPK